MSAEQNSGVDATVDEGASPTLGAGAPPAARRVDPTFKRNILIVGGFVGVVTLALIAVVTLRSGRAEAGGGAGAVGLGVAIAAQPSDEPITAAMAKTLEDEQALAAKNAAKRGDGVHIPDDMRGKPQPVDTASPATLAASSVDSGLQAQQQPSQADQQVLAERRARLQQGLDRQLAAIMGNVGGPAGSDVDSVMFTRTAKATTAASAQADAASAATASASQGTKITEALVIFPAEVASDVDTYQTKFCSAKIVGGKLSGAYLTGTCEVNEDGMTVKYTAMRWRGNSFAVSAIAMDESTSNDALQNVSIDRRRLERFVFPIFTAAGQAYATARSNTGSSVVTGANGTVVTTSPSSAQQAIYAGVGAGMQILAQQSAKEAAKPIQVTQKAGVSVGVMFLQPVFLANQ